MASWGGGACSWSSFVFHEPLCQPSLKTTATVPMPSLCGSFLRPDLLGQEVPLGPFRRCAHPGGLGVPPSELLTRWPQAGGSVLLGALPETKAIGGKSPAGGPDRRERVCPRAQEHVGVGARRGAFWGTDGRWGGALPPSLRCQLSRLACLHSLSCKVGLSAGAAEGSCGAGGSAACRVVRKWLLLLMNQFSVYLSLPFSLAKLCVSAEVQVCLVEEDEGPWS